ncbi:MAG: hypothetical protein ACI3XO_05175 [Eubacteriales bacterium]
MMSYDFEAVLIYTASKISGLRRFAAARSLLTKGATTVKVYKVSDRFFFDEAGAKKKLGKKKAP